MQLTEFECEGRHYKTKTPLNIVFSKHAYDYHPCLKDSSYWKAEIPAIPVAGVCVCFGTGNTKEKAMQNLTEISSAIVHTVLSLQDSDMVADTMEYRNHLIKHFEVLN